MVHHRQFADCLLRVGVVGLLLVSMSQAPADQKTPQRPSYPNASVLAEPSDLKGRLEDPRLVLLDVRSRRDYDAGHIPGARLIDAAQWEKHAAQPGGLRDVTGWSSGIGRLGIDNTKDVVVYSDEFRAAARIWWLLRYLGVERARLLNGGWDAWQKQGLPTSTETPRVEPKMFQAHLQAQRLADKDYMLRAIRSGSAVVCDARTQAEYTGKLRQAQRGGHIPTARHLDWKDLLDPEGRVKPPAELRSLLDQAGVTPTKPAVTYCQSGGRAAVDALVLELMGYPEVRNYYPSWNEWGNAQDTPIESGSPEADR